MVVTIACLCTFLYCIYCGSDTGLERSVQLVVSFDEFPKILGCQTFSLGRHVDINHGVFTAILKLREERTGHESSSSIKCSIPYFTMACNQEYPHITADPMDTTCYTRAKTFSRRQR